MRRGVGVLLGSVVLSLGFVAACGSAAGSGEGGSGGGAASGTGGGGGINVGGNGGSINVDGGGGSGNFQGCASDVHNGELVPLDMYMMLDKSASMQDSGKWSGVTGAIKQFVALPNLDKLGMGIALFPTPATAPIPAACTSDQQCGFYGPCVPGFNTCSGSLAGNDSCVATDYQKPLVPIAALPGVGPQITQVIDSASPDGASTPMAPALEGATFYAMGWAQAHPDHITAVVLATDGDPTNCMPNDVSDVAARAATALAFSPSVRTFVIGVGSSLTSRNSIAAAGGTDQAIIVDTTGNTGQQFLDALNKIRGGMVCQYQLPTGAKADPTKVNVQFTPDGQPGQTFPNVSDASKCLGQPAWYYDKNPPATPSQILLCPAACDLVKNQKGSLEIVLGCATQVA